MPEPPLPERVTADQLDRDARGRLRTIAKDNADQVARHLVMAGVLLETDPERAYEHAQAAVRRAGRVDVVREAAALTAYATGRFAEALRELRTVRRLSGRDAHRALEADCERGLGRPERALALAGAPEVRGLPKVEQVELAIVESGARLDLGEAEAALLVLERPLVRAVREPGLLRRLAEARATVLDALGREDAAAQELAAVGLTSGPEDAEDDVVVFDLEELVPEPDSAPDSVPESGPGTEFPADTSDGPVGQRGREDER